MGRHGVEGSIRKVKRAKGNHVWEWRYRVQGVMKQATHQVADYRTKKDLWKHLRLAIADLNDRVSVLPMPVAVTHRGSLRVRGVPTAPCWMSISSPSGERP